MNQSIITSFFTVELAKDLHNNIMGIVIEVVTIIFSE
jgi:hypothetical protein